MGAVQQTDQNSGPQWNNKPINSLDRVEEALMFLNMPSVLRDRLSQLSASHERGKFKSAIEECLQLDGATVRKETKRYLFGLVFCISEEMSQFLVQLGYQSIHFDILLHIGSTNGMSFRAAVISAISPNDPNHDQGVSLFETTLSEACESMGMALPTRGAPLPSSALESTNSKPTETPSSIEEASGANDKCFLSTHVYCSTAALCFNAAMSKSKETHTVIVDAAMAVGGPFDWKNAISMQLGHKELPLLYAVLVGWINTAKFDAHGPSNDKCFEITRQEGKFFAKVAAKGESVRAVPITALDAYPIAMVVLTQIMKQAPRHLQNHPDIVLHVMKQTIAIKPV